MARRKESFVRWQQITITQMGVAVNLILTFATASLGFTLTLFKDACRLDCPSNSCFLLLAGSLFMISIAAGLWCVLNRLADFRESARIAQKRERFEERNFGKAWINDQLRCLRLQNRKRGERSKALLRCQVWTFGAGALFLVIAFLVMYREKLVNR
jgi:hypothetical protein